ncbi:MAG: hypothetical protein ACRBN8_36995 [Nannocystales bacterium]
MTSPRILDTTNMDVELEPMLYALGVQEPSWVSRRSVASSPPDVGIDGHTPRSLVHALATAMDVSPASFEGGLILPDPPRRTDDEWTERKASGDKAFTEWLHTVSAVGAAAVGLAWVLYQLLFG